MGLKETEEGWGLGILFYFWSTMMKAAGPITASWAQWTKVSGTKNQNKINPPTTRYFFWVFDHYSDKVWITQKMYQLTKKVQDLPLKRLVTNHHPD